MEVIFHHVNFVNSYFVYFSNYGQAYKIKLNATLKFKKNFYLKIVHSPFQIMKIWYNNTTQLLTMWSTVINFLFSKRKYSSTQFDLDYSSFISIRSLLNSIFWLTQGLTAEAEKNCRSCGKEVYKMEEMKAERNIWHKNCFKCSECSKQLK